MQIHGEEFTIDDIYWEMSDYEKTEMLELLKDSISDCGDSPIYDLEDILVGNYLRPSEQELGAILLKLWESRDMLTKDQKKRLRQITLESYT